MAPLYIDLKNNSLQITVPNLKFKHEVDEILNFAEIHLPVYGQNKRFYP